MTKRKASAPNQVLLIQRISEMIDQSGFEFLNDHEKVTKPILLEGEWNHRVDTFINQYMGTDKLENDYTRAILARRYREYLPKEVYEWHTKVLKDPAEPKRSKAETVAKLQKLFKR